MELSRHKYLTQPCKCYFFKIVIFQSEVNDRQCGSGCAGPVGVRARPRDSHPCHEESPQKWSPSGTPHQSLRYSPLVIQLRYSVLVIQVFPSSPSEVPLQSFSIYSALVTQVLPSIHSGSPLQSLRYSPLLLGSLFFEGVLQVLLSSRCYTESFR